jgi:hypothetical protein
MCVGYGRDIITLRHPPSVPQYSCNHSPATSYHAASLRPEARSNSTPC